MVLNKIGMAIKYKSKEIQVEAFKFTWAVATGKAAIPVWAFNAIEAKEIQVGYVEKVVYSHWGVINTESYKGSVKPDDWIIMDANGKIYSCSNAEFQSNYEEL